MSVERYLQVPLDAEHTDQLARRAEESDRVISREAARIIKDVLDGRYVLAAAGVTPGMGVSHDD